MADQTTATATATVAVTTPTGHVGAELAAALVRAGIRPRLLLRDAGRLPASLASRADVVEVDQRDHAAVLKATEGVDALYWVSPTTGDDDPVAAHERLGRVAADAVTAHAIPRVVFQSSVGAELRGGAGEIDGLARTEELLDATGASVTHLRCGFFFTNLCLQIDALRAGAVPVLLPLDQPMPWVAPRDIAEVAALHLLSPHPSPHLQAVHGPEDLTWSQALAVVSDATGHPVRAERIEDDAMRAMLRSAGLTAAQTEAMVGMSTGLRDGFTPEQPRDPTTTTPTRLAGWAYETLRPVLARP
ncbi:NAD(P)H-binding protein [Streptomyces sp. ODS05-4]|uniref:NmrA family NAD(P)-binding protein n=1 Tax=Streptomyces sp. ODS05-4 TaxID=2944939 RepID=UPI00210919ED|nr:NAD(P)H-binding protein [Streptomyces sp. ODS05-4]